MRQAADLEVPLEIALLLSDQAESELPHVARVCQDVRPRVSTWLVYPTREVFTGGSPTERVVSTARQALGDSARLGAGTNTDFIFLQRTPPPTGWLDCVCLALNPQVHAFDDLSLIETLATQATVVNSARRWADGLPIVVSPVTLKPRHNPYATGAIPPAPPGELPPQVDPRQMSLLAAGWTLGSIKYLAKSGARSVTYFETTGWRGVMETARGSPVPEKFRSLPGAVFPLYHVLADVGEFAGGEVVSSTSSDPLRVQGLALRKDGRTRVLLANLTAEPQRVAVRLGPSARVRRLDETSARQAMQAPDKFRAHAGEFARAADGTLTFDLLPYAVIRVDAV
jgi:hypothetical protein